MSGVDVRLPMRGARRIDQGKANLKSLNRSQLPAPMPLEILRKIPTTHSLSHASPTGLWAGAGQGHCAGAGQIVRLGPKVHRLIGVVAEVLVAHREVVGVVPELLPEEAVGKAKEDESAACRAASIRKDLKTWTQGRDLL